MEKNTCSISHGEEPGTFVARFESSNTLLVLSAQCTTLGPDAEKRAERILQMFQMLQIELDNGEKAEAIKSEAWLDRPSLL